MALLDEVARSKGILVSVTAGKSLVGHVEESEVALLLHDIADLTPLCLCRVNTGGVVCASVEQDDAVIGGGLDIGDQTLKVQTNGVLVVVAVLLDLEAGILENGIVVGPAGVREVDLLRVWVEALQESTANSQGTSTRDGLGDDQAILLQHGRVGAIGQLGSGLGKGRNASDAGVFLVEARRDNLVLSSADRRQDVRLSLVVTYIAKCSISLVHGTLIASPHPICEPLTVGANAQVDLLLERVGLECLGDTENGVLSRPSR